MENINLVETKKIIEEKMDILIDSMTEEQLKNALKYLNHRTHTKNGVAVLLIFDHDMVNFDKGEEKSLGGFDCLSHTFADAIESAGVDLGS